MIEKEKEGTETPTPEASPLCDGVARVLGMYRQYWHGMTEFVAIAGADNIDLEALVLSPTLARTIIKERLIVKPGFVAKTPLTEIAAINSLLDTVSDDDLTVILIAAIIFADRG